LVFLLGLEISPLPLIVFLCFVSFFSLLLFFFIPVFAAFPLWLFVAFPLGFIVAFPLWLLVFLLGLEISPLPLFVFS